MGGDFAVQFAELNEQDCFLKFALETSQIAVRKPRGVPPTEEVVEEVLRVVIVPAFLLAFVEVFIITVRPEVIISEIPVVVRSLPVIALLF